jgi:formamidopyrimidine-DNA glycosylase
VPELPEIEAYLAALRPRVMAATLVAVRIASISLLRTFEPPVLAASGRRVVALERLGKRLVIGLDNDLFLVIHLMVAGRLQWLDAGARIPRKFGLAAFDFGSGTLLLTEAGTKRRASLHVVAGRPALAALDPGGIEVDAATCDAFRAALLTEPHTLKRALTDPRFFSGIGGAFADEILHRARLSPMQRNTNLDADEIERLWQAARDVLREWLALRLAETGEDFPTHVTAFHPRMAVHGRYRQPCPVCGAPVQRIVYADRETDYCPTCQTDGRILADRALSRLLKDDFPRRLEDLEG